MVTCLAPDLVTTNFNKCRVKVVSSSRMTGRVVLHFTNGTTHKIDMVADVDGFWSNVREFKVGTLAYAALIAAHQF